MNGSVRKFISRYLIRVLPSWFKSIITNILSENSSNKLPVLLEGASSNLRYFLDAWRIAQLSDASSPNQKVAYYSFNFEGHHFPGERKWEDRWKVLRLITNYEGKRILELGCNMSFLSCFLLKEERAVDMDADVLEAANLVSSALGVKPSYKQQNFDSPDNWEDKLRDFKPDIVFALNVLNWVQDKERLLKFLGCFNEVVFEGHDDYETEKNRFLLHGFKEIRLVSKSERNRPVIHCRK
jgi:hypothetical protein